jgi:phage-related protein
MRRNRRLHLKDVLSCLVVLTPLVFLGVPASAQSVAAQSSTRAQDNDTSRIELARFDQFLDSHREIAEQLRKDPSLVNNTQFVEKHAALQTFLQEHPGVREEIKENPNAFMRQENRFDRQEDRREDDRGGDTTRGQLARFDQFLDSHREIAEQLRKDPSLVNNKEYVEDHPALQTYLQEHPGIREEIKENPNGFMRQENRFDRQEARREDDRGGDTTRGQLARFDQFLDSHREIAEQLRKDPSLVNNSQFVEKHPALQTFLQEHPGVREEIKENPNGFMRQENRFDRQEARREDDRGGDTTRGQLARFDQFMDSHHEIAEQLRKDPSLVNNRKFVEEHPTLQAYLQEHPGIREEIKENPNGFMRQENRFDRQEARREDGRREDTNEHLASFREFLGGHSNIAQQVSKDPSLLKNDDYVKGHSELQEYLNAHPGVRGEMMENPHKFVKSAQQFNNTTGNGGTAKTPAPTADPKPKL